MTAYYFLEAQVPKKGNDIALENPGGLTFSIRV